MTNRVATFSYSGVKTCGFEAESSKEKSVKTNSVQTEILENEEKGSQVIDQLHVQVQTDSMQKNENIFADYDVDNLSIFLNRVVPHVCSILDKNVKSQAFVNYELLSDRESSSITCLHVLERMEKNEMNCCYVSWNSVGTSIAAAYTNNNHENWCDHDGSIGIWSLSQRNFDAQKPNIILETDCCITCVSFHPKIPSILVAGKFNGSSMEDESLHIFSLHKKICIDSQIMDGEIMLWNISKDDDNLLGSSKSSLNNHREPITGLFWNSESDSYDSLQFLSCSLDGKILMWRLEKNELVPFDGYVLLSDQLPRNFQIKSSRDNSEVGILSMSINHEDESIFIMGTEGGGVIQGSFNSLIPVSYSGFTSVSLKNPITMCFEKHKGQITSVQFSKFSRNIFLSCGSDGELRIYTLLQPKSILLLLHPSSCVNSAEWSLVRPMLLSSISSDGKLHIWDLTENIKTPAESIYLEDSKYAAGMSMRHNQESKNLLATSSSNGKVQIWQLPSFMLKLQIDEMQQLQSLSKTTE